MVISPEKIRIIREYVASNEDWRRDTYLDSDGHLTVGVGFKLDAVGAQESIEVLGINYDEARTVGFLFSDGQIDALFQRSLERALADARSTIPNFDTLTGFDQVAVVDMAFDLGRPRLSDLAPVIEAITTGDVQNAVDEIRNSEYYKHGGDRAQRNFRAVGTGLLPENGQPPHPKPVDTKPAKESKEGKDGLDEKESKDELEEKENKEVKDVPE